MRGCLNSADFAVVGPLGSLAWQDWDEIIPKGEGLTRGPLPPCPSSVTSVTPPDSVFCASCASLRPTCRPPSSVVRRLSSVLRLSAIRLLRLLRFFAANPPSSVLRHPSSVLRLLSTVYRPPSSVLCPPSSAVSHPTSDIKHPSSVRPSSVIRPPSSAPVICVHPCDLWLKILSPPSVFSAYSVGNIPTRGISADEQKLAVKNSVGQHESFAAHDRRSLPHIRTGKNPLEL